MRPACRANVPRLRPQSPPARSPLQPLPPTTPTRELSSNLLCRGATPQNDNASNSPLDASQYLKTTPQGNVVAEVTDLLFAADDDTLRPAFENRSVEIIGQFMPTKDTPVANRFQLVRMFMVCCAADARPIAISVDPKSTVKFPDMSWARVVGKVAFPVENGRRIPVVQAVSAAKCDPPGELMLY